MDFEVKTKWLSSRQGVNARKSLSPDIFPAKGGGGGGEGGMRENDGGVFLSTHFSENLQKIGNKTAKPPLPPMAGTNQNDIVRTGTAPLITSCGHEKIYLVYGIPCQLQPNISGGLAMGCVHRKKQTNKQTNTKGEEDGR